MRIGNRKVTHLVWRRRKDQRLTFCVQGGGSAKDSLFNIENAECLDETLLNVRQVGRVQGWYANL